MHLLSNPFLDNKLIIREKLKNAEQIYTYIMKLKFNYNIGLNSNCRHLYYTGLIAIADNCITQKTLSLCL